MVESVKKEGSLRLECEGYRCPDVYVNDFTPLEFEELVSLFKKFDKDKSGAVDADELYAMMKYMDMEHSMDAAREFMQVIDGDGSGQLEFSEFASLIATVKRGDAGSKLEGFAKLADEVETTPASLLAVECEKRGLRCTYSFVEKREATANSEEFVVMEVVLRGRWFELVDGVMRESTGDRRYQGIAKTTREARYNAAKAALSKMKKSMPGVDHEPGIIPPDWRAWVWENVSNGCQLEGILKTLQSKGFHPWRNIEFMQRILLISSYTRWFFGDNKIKSRFIYKDIASKMRCSMDRPQLTNLPQVSVKIHFEEDDPLNKKKKLSQIAPRLEQWIDHCLSQGYDGSLIVDMLADPLANPLTTLPRILQNVRRSRPVSQLDNVLDINQFRKRPLSLIIDVQRPRLMAFDLICEKDWLTEAELYFHAGQDPNLEYTVTGERMLTPLQIAAEHGSLSIVKILLQHGAQVETQDKLGRTPLHLAAAHGFTQICRLLILDADANVHAADNCFDTALHIAARNNHTETCHELASIEENFVRETLAGVRKVNGQQELVYIFNDCYAYFIAKNLKEYEVRHFRKEWIFEAALYCYTKKMGENTRKYVTRPVPSAAQTIIDTLDPDPESGFVTRTLVNGDFIEAWVPTVAKPAHLVDLLKLIYQFSALQTPNHLGRTPLHEACYANLAASHEDTIRYLIDFHVGNVHAIDDHGRTPRDLILLPRRRPGSPTGNPLREDIIDERREILLGDYAAATEAIELAKSNQRKVDALRSAIEYGTDLSAEDWRLLKAMSRFKRSFATIEEYEDTDTLNRFYRWSHDDDEDTANGSGGSSSLKSASEVLALQESRVMHSWEPPEQFLFEERVAQALEHIRRNAHYLRTIGDWSIYRDLRHRDDCYLYVSDSIANSGGIGITTCKPTPLAWHRIHSTAISVGSLGASDEWTMYQIQGGTIFYHKSASNEFRWHRPVDAVEKVQAGVSCTNLTYDFKRTVQNWYTCEQCNATLKNQATRLQICIHCARKCHAGHEGVKFVRKGSVACGCHHHWPCQLVVTEHLDQSRTLEFAAAESQEAKRRDRVAATPTVLAYIPERIAPALNVPEGINGWALCRQLSGTKIINGWQIVVDPTEYYYIEPGSEVLVDRSTVSGCKIEGNVHEVHRKNNGELFYTIALSPSAETTGEESMLREHVLRNEFISVEYRFFFWHAQTVQSSWELPDVDVDVRLALESQLRKRKEESGQLTHFSDALVDRTGFNEQHQLQVNQRLTLARAVMQASGNGNDGMTVASVAKGADPVVAFDSTFRPSDAICGSENIRWPTLTGTEWDELVAKHSRLLRCFGNWEEYEHVRTQSRFWRNTAVAEDETAVRLLQRVYRQVFFRSAKPNWYSQAFFWIKTDEIRNDERERNGWALLRRRATLLRECVDTDGRDWHEYLDSASGELFYYMPNAGDSQWERPNIADHSTTEARAGVFEVGNEVLFRFPGDEGESFGVITQVRIDPDTPNGKIYDLKSIAEKDLQQFGERYNASNSFQEYSRSSSVSEEISERYVTRIKPHRIRHRPLTHEHIEQKREENLWRTQLRQAKEAEERDKKRKDRELQSSLFSRVRHARSVRCEDIQQARKARAAFELEQLEVRECAEAERMRNLAVMANAEDEGIDMKALRAQQTGVSILRVEETDEELRALASEVEKTRERMQNERRQRELQISQREIDEKRRQKCLENMENRGTTPRSAARRRILRQLYRTAQRQQSGYMICEWGCGEWTKVGREKLFHEKESCIKRVMPCALGCPLKMREEQWVASHSTDDDKVQMTVLMWHEKFECPRRLVPCTRHCGEWVADEDLKYHMDELCIKRPFADLYCRLGCGQKFTGAAHEILQREALRLEHEQEMCQERLVQCTYKRCAIKIKAKDRFEHRKLHTVRDNVNLYSIPGIYSYKVPPGIRQLKVELWGAGGGSGHLRHQAAGSGGGGAYVEALLLVFPGEFLQITVATGGEAGVRGRVDTTPGADDEAQANDICGIAAGGTPGGGNGYGGNEVWACGGGGGYTMIERFTQYGPRCMVLAAGGGGAGSRNGEPGGGIGGELQGTRIDKRNGRMGSSEYGGKAGDSGESALCAFPAQDGQAWQGGYGSQFGGGGGGGLFGGGGGGTSPGIAGGGGGGASYVDVGTVADFKVLQGEGVWSGGSKEEYAPPRACGIGEWDYDQFGGLAGQGGGASVEATNPGRNGAVRIARPGFYNEDMRCLQQHTEQVKSMAPPTG